MLVTTVFKCYLYSNMHVELKCPIKLISVFNEELRRFFKNIFNKIRINPYMLRTPVGIYNIYVGPINAATFSLDTSV